MSNRCLDFIDLYSKTLNINVLCLLKVGAFVFTKLMLQLDGNTSIDRVMLLIKLMNLKESKQSGTKN